MTNSDKWPIYMLFMACHMCRITNFVLYFLTSQDVQITAHWDFASTVTLIPKLEKLVFWYRILRFPNRYQPRCSWLLIFFNFPDIFPITIHFMIDAEFPKCSHTNNPPCCLTCLNIDPDIAEKIRYIVCRSANVINGEIISQLVTRQRNPEIFKSSIVGGQVAMI